MMSETYIHESTNPCHQCKETYDFDSFRLQSKTLSGVVVLRSLSCSVCFKVVNHLMCKLVN